MKLDEFEKELQAIDKDLSIRPNNPPKRVIDAFPDTLKLASITYRGSELCAIPNYEIFDEPNLNYGVDLRQDGRFVKHRTRPEALAIVKERLDKIKNDKEYADQFFGTGEYSETALRTPLPEVKGETMLVEEVPIDLKEVKGGTIEGPK